MKLHDVDLCDAVKEHGDRKVWIPSSEITKSLKYGDLMKVACNGELFWVRVKKVEDAGEYLGTVHDILLQKELNYGMLISVSHNHIYDVLTIADQRASKAIVKR